LQQNNLRALLVQTLRHFQFVLQWSTKIFEEGSEEMVDRWIIRKINGNSCSL